MHNDVLLRVTEGHVQCWNICTGFRSQGSRKGNTLGCNRCICCFYQGCRMCKCKDVFVSLQPEMQTVA